MMQEDFQTSPIPFKTKKQQGDTLLKKHSFSEEESLSDAQETRNDYYQLIKDLQPKTSLFQKQKTIVTIITEKEEQSNGESKVVKAVQFETDSKHKRVTSNHNSMPQNSMLIM